MSNTNFNNRPTARDLEMRMRTGTTGYRPGTSGSNDKKNPGNIIQWIVFGWIGISIAFSISGILGFFALIALLGLILYKVVPGVFGTAAKPAERPAAAYSNAAARAQQQQGHLCDPGQHSAEERSSRAALDDMEDGYASYAGSPSYTYTVGSPAARGARNKLTREQYRKKLEELKSLRDAGIITDEEYHHKTQEYSSYTV